MARIKGRDCLGAVTDHPGPQLQTLSRQLLEQIEMACEVMVLSDCRIHVKKD